MTQKQPKKKEKKELTPEELMKYEIADELGLLERVQKEGWKSLTSRESGRIGGIISKRNKQKQSCTKLSDN